MKNLILIPNVHVYFTTVLMTLTLGSFNVARSIHIRWLKSYVSLVTTNACIKGILTIGCLYLVPFPWLFPSSINQEAVALCLGLFLGSFTIYMELRMLRKRQNHSRYRIDSYKTSSILRNAIVKPSLLLSTKCGKERGLRHLRQRYLSFLKRPNFLDYTLISVIIVAIAEECLFRGMLLSVPLKGENLFFAMLMLSASILLFAASHMSNDWFEFKSKLPLAICTTFSFVMTHALLGAIIIHSMLNYFAYTNRR